MSGHALDVYTAKFFPSGVVILSGGADTQIKVWSAQTGECAATMTGHQAGMIYYMSRKSVTDKECLFYKNRCSSNVVYVHTLYENSFHKPVIK